MDAGVPLKAPVAGVAMGLILEGEKFAVLTDILGDEDHLGDMDFKVAGTANGITSLQMDIKVAGITPAIMEQALAQAKEGRMHILGEMSHALTAGRSEFSAHAPRIETMQIAVDKIREVIGSGGKVIRSHRRGVRRQGRHQRRRHHQDRLGQRRRDREGPRADRRHRRRAGDRQDLHRPVVKIMDFGAFVNFFGKRDGLVHVSQLSNERVGHPKDILQEGQSREGQAHGLRRARQGPPLDEGRRPGDRQGNRRRDRHRRVGRLKPQPGKGAASGALSLQGSSPS